MGRGARISSAVQRAPTSVKLAHFVRGRQNGRMVAVRFSVRPVSILAFGCLVALLSACTPRASTPPEVAELAPTPYKETLPALEGESGPVAKKESPRRVGDIWVHRFSGSYRAEHLLLREEVIAEKGGVLIVDFTLTEGDVESQLRVEMARGSERIISVARVVDNDVLPGSLADFEALLQKTSFVPDQNHGKVTEKSQTCLVGKDELNCELAEYKVLVGEKEATLTVARNEELRRDIAGEITAVDGTVLYHAELIEMQRGKVVEEAQEGLALVNEKIDFDARH